MVHATLQRRANSANSKRLILWSSIVAVAALTAGLMQIGFGHSFLERIGLYENPASYTSLAFTNPQSLPAHLSSASTKMGISFDLTNTSAGPQSYHWSIMLERTGRDKRLSAGEINVPIGSRVTVARTVKVSCVKRRVRMMVKIADPAESIYFWMACSARKGGKP